MALGHSLPGIFVGLEVLFPAGLYRLQGRGESAESSSLKRAIRGKVEPHSQGVNQQASMEESHQPPVTGPLLSHLVLRLSQASQGYPKSVTQLKNST